MRISDWSSDVCASDLLDAVEARRLSCAKKLSPVELLESCIERIEAVNPAINAVVTKDYDRARKAAKAAEDAVMRGEKLGALHGLPMGVKDLTNTAGMRTTKSEEHTSELQSLMRISYAVFCSKKKSNKTN